MSVIIYVKFFTVRPLKQVTIRRSESCQVGSTKISKFFLRLNISNKENRKKPLHLNIVHCLTEKHLNFVLYKWNTNSIYNIAPIRINVNKYLARAHYFANIAHHRSFHKSEERLENKRGHVGKDSDIKTLQILTMSQQNSSSIKKTSYSNSILFMLKNLQSKNGQYTDLTKFFLSNANFLKFPHYYYVKDNPITSFKTLGVVNYN